MQELYQRLNQVGFDRKFVRQYVLPDWWDDTLAGNPATQSIAEVYISRMVGIPIQTLRTPKAPLAPTLNHQFRLKRNNGVQVDELLPAIVLAQSLGSTFASALDDLLPRFEAGYKAPDIRQEILRDYSTVNLAGLLAWCWAHGIIVLHLCQLPQNTKKFSGIAMLCEGRPVIVLASGCDSPPWLAFHLAHELGHILRGHVERGHSLLDDDIDRRRKINDLMADPTFDTYEADANVFAMLLLTSRPELGFALQNIDGETLAKRVRQLEQKSQVDAGTLALIYGHTTARMGVAQNALKFLGLNQGAHQLIANAVKRHLPEDAPEAVAAFLPLIGCEL
jgi:Zn-dependent peptidase ImmA (M78 family)